MIDVRCYNRQRVFGARETFHTIEEAAEHALFCFPSMLSLMGEGIRIAVDVTLVGPRVMRRINREQRGIDSGTDILSFPARAMNRGEFAEKPQEWEFMELSGGSCPSLMIGELIISPTRVAEQADELGHSFERELRFLVIHGVLHLLGYDHQSSDEEREMIAMQKAVMAGLEEIPCGFAALTGRPNVGKSTLLNAIAGRTLAITSPKPQTTRHAIRSVFSTDEYQIAFIDTPGIHRPESALGKAMMKAASNAIQQSDVVVLMVEAAWRPVIGTSERQVIQQTRKNDIPVILVINKIDASPKENVLPLIQAYEEAYQLAAYVPISAKKDDGIDLLIREIVRMLPVRRRLFTPGDETDQTEKVLAGELIRREVLFQTDREIPHGVTVIVESFDESDSKGKRSLTIDAVILCGKESHKQIMIGKGGSKIKSIGTAAREAMESLFEARVNLSLFVKVRSGWQNRTEYLQDSGLLEK